MTARAPTAEERQETYNNEKAQASADGILWPWEDYGAWQKSIMPITVDDAALKASFEGAESGLSPAIKGAMKSAVQSGSVGDFREAFRDAVLDGLIDGYIASKAYQDTIGTPLNEFYKVANNPDSSKEEIDAAWAVVEDGYARAEGQILESGKRWADSFGAEQLSSELKGMFASAFQSGMDARLDLDVDTSSADAFKEAFTGSLKEMVKQRLIEAFLQSAAMKPLFDQLGAVIGNAMKDGIIGPEEQAQIDALVGDIADASETLYEALEGLEGEKRIDLIVEKGSLNDLWKEYESTVDNGRRQAKEAELQGQIALNNQKKVEIQAEMALLKLKRAQMLAKGNLMAAEKQYLIGVQEALGTSHEQLVVIDEQNEALQEQIDNLEALDKKARDQLVAEIKARLQLSKFEASLVDAALGSNYRLEPSLDHLFTG